jgi:hypothetical protein
MRGVFEILEGQDDLQKILNNPELTTDKLSMKEWTRIVRKEEK